MHDSEHNSTDKKNSGQSDAKLLELMSNGNFQALRGIFYRHAREIYDLAYHQTRSDAASQHLVLLVFERFWNRRDMYHPTVSARGFLLEIAGEVFPKQPEITQSDLEELFDDPDINKLWEKFVQRVPEKQVEGEAQASAWRYIRRLAARILPQRQFRSTYLSIMIVLFAMLVIYSWFRNNPAIGYTKVKTSQHEQKVTVLPDGSEIHLEENSEIRYSKTFTDSLRAIFLTGRATFKAVPNVDIPFVVVTNPAVATLFGNDTTVFWISSNDTIAEFYVEKGYLAVKSLPDDSIPEIYISPNGKAVCELHQPPRLVTLEE
jgi:hypothetical protein